MRRLFLLAVVFLFVAEVHAQVAAAPSFEVTTVKPAKPDATGEDWDTEEATTHIGNYPVVKLIRAAYDLKSVSQIVGAPEWMQTLRVDVSTKVSAEDVARMKALPVEERSKMFGQMLQTMLAERFGLRATMSTKTMPALALERVSPTALGPGLKPVGTDPDGRATGGTHASRSGGHWEASGQSMEGIAKLLSTRYEMGGRVVVDKTGVPGYFRFTLDYAPDNGTGVPPDATLPGLVDAVREQLGLKLVKTDGLVPVVVVQSATKPEFD